ncbi:hypothetical protein [Halorussus salinus]|uniref:hypothetical protein n=1 Tax=Halorussus salinus TaxID=1364935 RepID=UPI0010922CBD|nr:hypothetical protein [Halorussus salinus]
MSPFPLLLANRARLTQTTVHEAVHDWLSGHAGFETVRYEPSSIRREAVHADVDPGVMLQTDYDASTVRLEVQFEFPQNESHEYYRIQWVEPDRDASVGWHRDDHRNQLGECHLQLDSGGDVADVQAAGFVDSHPLNVLETRLNHLPVVLNCIDWTGDVPEFDGDIYGEEIECGDSLTLERPSR